MIYNFEAWRRAKQKQFADGQLRHYHRCTDCSYYLVREILQKICSKWVGEHQRRFTISPSEFEVDLIFNFLTEMEVGYIHPRSTSARYLFKKTACES